MRSILLLCVLLFTTVTGWATAPDSIHPFQSTIQLNGDLQIDKIKIQNLNVVKKAVEGIGKTLPQKVDDYTTMVGVDSNGTELIYIFEVDAGPKSDTTLREEGKKRMAPVVRKGICSNAKRFLESDITITYRYLNQATKNEILKVTMDKKKCAL